MAKCEHKPPERFTPGRAFELRVAVSGEAGATSAHAARLLYRHVNQAERWNAVDAKGENGTFAAAIPAAYTESEFGLEYYFELEDGRGAVWMYPGFNRTLSNQPYFCVYKRSV